NDDSYTTDEDSVLAPTAATGLLANDSDLDGDAIQVDTAGSDSQSALGVAVTYQPDGRFTYDPTNVTAIQKLPVGASTTDTFNYRIVDIHGAADSATVSVTVDGRNDAPQGAADNYATLQNRVLFVNQASSGLLANDTDIDTGDTLAVDPARSDTMSAKGAVVAIAANGTFSYDPTQSAELAQLRTGETANDTFSYTVVDPHGASDVVTVTVVVTGVDSSPLTGDDLYATNEDSLLQVTDPNQGVLANDRDPEGDPVTLVSSDTVSSNGATIVMQPNGTFTYDPRSAPALQALNVGDTLDDVFHYVVRDPQDNRSTGTVKVTVSGLNDAPVAEDDAFQVRPNQSHDLDVIANDSDIDGTIDPTSVVIIQAPSHGTAVPQNDGTIRYTPTAGFSGQDLVLYQVRDNSGALSGLARVDINVNEPPVAVDDAVTAFNNGPTRIAVLANDSDSDGTLDPDTVTIIQVPQNGLATVQSDGSVIYRPNAGYLGADGFTYT
ncbi:MAG: tandem-95 repeat protein, partial [Planctomycetota bacterium]